MVINMKLKCEFEIVDMGDEWVAVPVGQDADNVSGVVKLNSTGKEILELLKVVDTEEGLLSVLNKRYDNDSEELKNLVHAFLVHLGQMGILD